MAQHIIVVGGGVIGLCAAYYSLLMGHRVTVLERGGPGHDGCSFGNAGMIVPSHFVPLAAPGAVALGLKWMWNSRSPFYIKPRPSLELAKWGWNFWRAANAMNVTRSAPLLRDLHLASRSCYEELARQGNDFSLVKRGLLMLCRTRHALEEEARTAAVAQRLGIPAEVLDCRQTEERDPGLRMHVAGSVYFPRDCHLTPGRFMDSLARRLETNKASFSWETEVNGWHTSGNQIESIRTTRGEFSADQYVLAGGAWSQAIARDLRLTLPIQAGKGYSLTLRNPRRLPTLCSILTEARVAVTPMGSSLRFGGTMEFAGLDESISQNRVQAIVGAAHDYFPEFTSADFQEIRPWSGLRPCTPDGLPYLGRTALYSNLVIATGHAMMGMSLGPITGKLVAQILSGQKPDIDVTLLNPDRYA